MSNEKPARSVRARATAALLGGTNPNREKAIATAVAPSAPTRVSDRESDRESDRASEKPSVRAGSRAIKATETEASRIEYPVPSREAMLAELRSVNMPMMPAELASRLGVSSDEMSGFERRLSAMERDGQLMPNRKGVLHWPTSSTSSLAAWSAIATATAS